MNLQTIQRRRRVRLASALSGALLSMALAACGGGSSTTGAAAPPATAASATTVQQVSANTAVVPTTTTTAVAASVDTAQAVVAAGQASQTIDCAGGGTAVYQVTGPSLALITNGQFDAGENYTLTFNACKGAAGWDTINGTMTLDVVSASATRLDLATTTSSVVVTTPRGNVTLNGSSTITRSVTTSGTATTTTTEWKTPSFSIVTAFNGRSSTFTFTNVDRIYSVTTTGGVVSSTSHSGTGTLTASLPEGAFSVTESTQGAVTYDASGMPIQGTWTITLPSNAITVTVGGGTVTVAVDWGADGTIDRTYTFQVGTLDTAAG